VPDFSLEQACLSRGARLIAGVDEAGRGPLAGPVVAAAVILDPARLPAGLDDSKKLTAANRVRAFAEILSCGQVSVVSAPPRIIAQRNIRGATLWAMLEAVAGLGVEIDHVLVDGRDVPPGLPCDCDAVIGGDGQSISIAAASIVAKVTRDAMCPVMDRCAPGYEFSAHKGYGTAAHRDALARLGASVHHRSDFAPVRAALEGADVRQA